MLICLPSFCQGIAYAYSAFSDRFSVPLDHYCLSLWFLLADNNWLPWSMLPSFLMAEAVFLRRCCLELMGLKVGHRFDQATTLYGAQIGFEISAFRCHQSCALSNVVWFGDGADQAL